jgi:hypothetical protein
MRSLGTPSNAAVRASSASFWTKPSLSTSARAKAIRAADDAPSSRRASRAAARVASSGTLPVRSTYARRTYRSTLADDGATSDAG